MTDRTGVTAGRTSVTAGRTSVTDRLTDRYVPIVEVVRQRKLVQAEVMAELEAVAPAPQEEPPKRKLYRMPTRYVGVATFRGRNAWR